MNLLFTICARAGSKGVREKNIRLFLEYPIVFYTLSAYRLFCMEYGKQYARIDLAVNTDSDALVEQIEKTNICFKYIERKEELGGDIVSKSEVIKDTVRKLEEIEDVKYDLVIDLDVTSPLRRAEDIQKTVESLLASTEADVAFSVTNSRRLPFFNMVSETNEGYYLPLINRGYVSRQQAPQCYDMNASIYVYRHAFIAAESNKKLFDGKAVIWEMKDTGVLDIDNEEDFELMQVLAKYFFEHYDDFGIVYQGIGRL